MDHQGVVKIMDPATISCDRCGRFTEHRYLHAQEKEHMHMEDRKKVFVRVRGLMYECQECRGVRQWGNIPPHDRVVTEPHPGEGAVIRIPRNMKTRRE